jgi:hypothetical protein
MNSSEESGFDNFRELSGEFLVCVIAMHDSSNDLLRDRLPG